MHFSSGVLFLAPNRSRHIWSAPAHIYPCTLTSAGFLHYCTTAMRCNAHACFWCRTIPRKWAPATRPLPGNRDLHERGGRGAPGGAVVVLVAGLDLSTGKTGGLARAGGGLVRGVVQMQVCQKPPETDPTFAWFASLPLAVGVSLLC